MGNDGLTVLIVDDGRPGHRNQSLAFCRLKGFDHRIVRVTFSRAFNKFLSMLADWLGIYTQRLFRSDPLPEIHCDAVVSTGSGTYYANKVFARRLNVPSVALMTPRGFRFDFDWIVAPEHDRPPKRGNVVITPVNLCFPRPEGIFRPAPGERWVGVVLGGPNDIYDFDAVELRESLEAILRAFPEHRRALTTSPRTPAAVEQSVDELPFDYKLIYSRDPRNPIPDFVMHCDWVFVTPDSTSMLSEAVSFGDARVGVLPLREKARGGKFRRLIDNLVDRGLVVRFDGHPPDASLDVRKIDLKKLLEGVKL